MITVYFKKDNRVEHNFAPSRLADLSTDDILWIDLDAPTETERAHLEHLIGMKLLTRAQAEEIESTSKYFETPDAIVSNCNYFISRGHSYDIEPTSFIITKDNYLVSVHKTHPETLKSVGSRIACDPANNESGRGVFMTVLENLIDYDADMLELINRQISTLAKDLNSANNINKEVLQRINSLQEKITSMRENIFDLERVLSAMMRSPRFPKETESRLSLMMKDVESLVNHGDICFERLDYMQDTALGLINIEQNEIVKILSVAAVIFMPPTLIASMYGMNFKVMPELDWTLPLSNGWIIPAGYIFALFLMVLVSLLTYWFFRYKKWL